MPKFGPKPKKTLKKSEEKKDNIDRLTDKNGDLVKVGGAVLGTSEFNGSVNAVIIIPDKKPMFLGYDKMEWLAEHAAEAFKKLTEE